MTPKCIFFDLDGTLTDSGPGIISCAKATLAHYGYDVPDDATMRTMVGPPLRQSFARFGFPAEQVDEAVVYYRKLYVAGGKYENTPYPGVCELLEKLRKDGHRLFVATSKPEHMSVDILQHFHMDHYFEYICGALVDGIRDKKSAVIAHLMETVGSCENIVMVGDTVFDVLGAAEHAIPTIAVSWGYGEEEDMVKAGAVAVAHTMDELYSLLSK